MNASCWEDIIALILLKLGFIFSCVFITFGYFENVITEMPFGWRKLVDSDGKVTFHNETTDISTHSDPRLAFAIELDKSNTDIRYKFDASSTALEILHGIDLSNKVAVVTGSNTGIGSYIEY